ncbi:hypothetical protein PRIC1_004620 [Phytophthora ramorum]
MSHAVAVLVFRILAGCSYLVMLTSPSLNIYRINKAKSVGVQSIFPLVSLLANSHIWMMYGYLAKIYFPVFSCFLVGYANNMIWLTYGSLITNWFMISINIFFFSMSTFTLVLYHIYDPKTHPLKDGWDTNTNENSEDDVQLQISVDPADSKDKNNFNLPSPQYEAMRSPIAPARAD